MKRLLSHLSLFSAILLANACQITGNLDVRKPLEIKNYAKKEKKQRVLTIPVGYHKISVGTSEDVLILKMEDEKKVKIKLPEYFPTTEGDHRKIYTAQELDQKQGLKIDFHKDVDSNTSTYRMTCTKTIKEQDGRTRTIHYPCIRETTTTHVYINIQADFLDADTGEVIGSFSGSDSSTGSISTTRRVGNSYPGPYPPHKKY